MLSTARPSRATKRSPVRRPLWRVWLATQLTMASPGPPPSPIPRPSINGTGLGSIGTRNCHSGSAVGADLAAGLLRGTAVALGARTEATVGAPYWRMRLVADWYKVLSPWTFASWAAFLRSPTAPAVSPKAARARARLLWARALLGLRRIARLYSSIAPAKSWRCSLLSPWPIKRAAWSPVAVWATASGGAMGRHKPRTSSRTHQKGDFDFMAANHQ